MDTVTDNDFKLLQIRTYLSYFLYFSVISNGYQPFTNSITIFTAESEMNCFTVPALPIIMPLSAVKILEGLTNEFTGSFPDEKSEVSKETDKLSLVG